MKNYFNFDKKPKMNRNIINKNSFLEDQIKKTFKPGYDLPDLWSGPFYHGSTVGPSASDSGK